MYPLHKLCLVLSATAHVHVCFPRYAGEAAINLLMRSAPQANKQAGDLQTGTPLHVAAAQGKVDVFRPLLTAGARWVQDLRQEASWHGWGLQVWRQLGLPPLWSWQPRPICQQTEAPRCCLGTAPTPPPAPARLPAAASLSTLTALPPCTGRPRKARWRPCRR